MYLLMALDSEKEFSKMMVRKRFRGRLIVEFTEEGDALVLEGRHLTERLLKKTKKNDFIISC